MEDNENNYGYGTVDLISPVFINRNRNVNGLGSLVQYDQTPTVQQPQQTQMYANNTNVKAPEYNFNTNTNTSTSTPGMWDSVKNLFTPNEKGTSTGGQLMSGLGTIGQLGTSIWAGITQAKNDKYAKEISERNYARQVAQDNYLKSRDAMADAKIAQTQANYDKTA